MHLRIWYKVTEAQRILQCDWRRDIRTIGDLTMVEQKEYLESQASVSGGLDF